MGGLLAVNQGSIDEPTFYYNGMETKKCAKQKTNCLSW